jgi:hypothetical protein
MNATLHIHVRVSVPVDHDRSSTADAREQTARAAVDRLNESLPFAGRVDLISVHVVDPAPAEGAEPGRWNGDSPDMQPDMVAHHMVPIFAPSRRSPSAGGDV